MLGSFAVTQPKEINMGQCRHEEERGGLYYCSVYGVCVGVSRSDREGEVVWAGCRGEGTCSEFERQGEEKKVVEEKPEDKPVVEEKPMESVEEKPIERIEVGEVGKEPKGLALSKEGALPKEVEELLGEGHTEGSIKGAIGSENRTMGQRVLEVELTLTQIGKYFEVERHTIARWLKAGKLRSNKLSDIIFHDKGRRNEREGKSKGI